MRKIIISTESGSDIPYKITIPYGIEVVPMHIAFGEKVCNDGTFQPYEIFNYYNENRKLPTTSAVNPQEYINHFRVIFAKYPNCKIIHISYSSKLSATHQNAVIASNEFSKDKLCILDSKNVTGGIGLLVMKAAMLAQKYQDKMSFEELTLLIRQYIGRIKCTFLPNTLDYLKAGGRISTATHLGAAVLNVKPSIVTFEGQLISGKKYRGNISAIAEKLFYDFIAQNNFEKENFVIIYSYGLNVTTLFRLKRLAHKEGFKKSWCFQTGSAVSCHAGPSCVGFAGITKA